MKSIFFLLLWMNFSFINLEKASSKENQDILLTGISTVTIIKIYIITSAHVLPHFLLAVLLNSCHILVIVLQNQIVARVRVWRICS
jgi:hypothetical protein